jgi:RNA polymerase sigma-70 factor, ECF subfamily
MPPDELILDYYKGRETAFAELHNGVWHVLLRFLIHQGAERFLAEDLAQETMYRIARTRVRGTRFDPSQGSFLTWALTIARRVWYDHMRKRSRRIQESVSLEPTDPDAPPPPEPWQAAEQETGLLEAEKSGWLRTALACLPAEQREAVILHDLEGLSYEDVGKMTDALAATAASRRKLGIEKIRAAWNRSSAREGGAT